MKKHILLQCMVLAAVLLLSACAGDSISPETTTAPKETQADFGQMLKLSMQKDEENTQGFSTEELGGNFNRGLLYRRVKDVTIEIDGEEIPLEEALAQGKITEEALWYYGQQDARNGFCQENWESRLGLSWVTLDYGDYTVVMAKDVYETPDGQQHLISAMKVHDPQNGKYTEPIYGSYYDEETWQRIDREDWGIEFSVVEASPTEIILNYTQSGGQLIGQLFTCGYEINNLDLREGVTRLDTSKLQEQFPISMNAQGSLTLDIETYFGALPAGQYGMYLYLQDTYGEEDVPPLTRNYHDMQCYWVEFTIS